MFARVLFIPETFLALYKELDGDQGLRNVVGEEHVRKFCVVCVSLQILVRTMLRKRSFGNPFDWARREERGPVCAAAPALT